MKMAVACYVSCKTKRLSPEGTAFSLHMSIISTRLLPAAGRQVSPDVG